MGGIFAQVDARVTALTLAVAMFATWSAARRIGLRLWTAASESRTTKFDDASLALLGLLLAFTFSMSLGKHEQRRLMVVADGNAIGDFYTCAGLLDDPVRCTPAWPTSSPRPCAVGHRSPDRSPTR
jgi:hypothetical protein